MRIGKARSAIDAAPGADMAQEKRMMEIARQVGEAINRFYPNHYFYVRVEKGCVLISNPTLTGNYRQVIHLKTLASDPGMACVKRAAGEILERFNVPRTKLNRDHWRSDIIPKMPIRQGPKLVYMPDGTARRVAPDALRG